MLAWVLQKIKLSSREEEFQARLIRENIIDEPSLLNTAKSNEQSEFDAAVEKAMGSMAGLLPSTEQILAWKREEVELEEQRYERLFGSRPELYQ